jgi:acyl transferase domain-containing protein
MLPVSYHQPYQVFCQSLERFGEQIHRANPDTKLLQVMFLEAQQQFQQQIMGQTLADLDAVVESKVQSFQTEINKQLRLLAMDVMFLQTARQPTTIQQRQAQMGDRLQLLRRYCEAILDSESQ